MTFEVRILITKASTRHSKLVLYLKEKYGNLCGSMRLRKTWFCICLSIFSIGHFVREEIYDSRIENVFEQLDKSINSLKTTKRNLWLTRCWWWKSLSNPLLGANGKREWNLLWRGFPHFCLTTDVRSLILRVLTHLNSANSLKKSSSIWFFTTHAQARAMCWYKYVWRC